MRAPWSLLCVLGLSALIASGCGRIQSQPLLATLPLTAGGVTLDQSLVVDDSLWVGRPEDDVLAALGKRRPDATMVDRYSNSVDGEIGAIAVSDISGDLLLKTVVEVWDAAAAVSRTQTTIGDRDVWVLEMRPGRVFLAYRRDSTVYWASSDNQSLAEEFIAAMP